MMGKRIQRAAKLFHVGFNLEDRVPPEHPLRRIESVVDFTFVRPMVAEVYGRNGHESLDPVVVLKLLFLCYYENIRSERELMRQLPLRLDWLWFCHLDLDDPIPDHSVLSKARKRWGEGCFEKIFERVVHLCLQAGLLSGQTVHADSTLLKANASLEGRIPRKLWRQLEEASGESGMDQKADQKSDEDVSGGVAPDPAPAATKAKTPAKLNERLVSPVDPDAATSTRKAGGTTLGYRDHRLVDDRCGIILATLATSADRDDGAMLPELLSRQEQYIHTPPREVVGDSMYGTQANYDLLKQTNIKAYLKKRRGKDSPKTSWLKLLPQGCWKDRALYLLGRRRSRAEGSFAEAHNRMNHRRCRWRRRQRVQMQCYLVATVQNIKKLARSCSPRRPVGALRAVFAAAGQLALTLKTDFIDVGFSSGRIQTLDMCV
jgi:transposase